MTSGRGAFAEYAKAYSDIIWEVPEETYSHEEVAATGIPYARAPARLTLTPTRTYLDSTLHYKACSDPTPNRKAKVGFSFTEGALPSRCMRFSSPNFRGTRSPRLLRLGTTSSSRVTERMSSSM